MNVFAKTVQSEYETAVSHFIDMIKNNDINKLSDNVSYPLIRHYPIAAIKDKKDFIKRYPILFDETLKKMIVNSNPKKDWHPVGGRGIMLFSGVVWLDYDGNLIAVNYASVSERETEEKFLKEENNKLYPPLKDFKKLEFIVDTKEKRIRVDDVGGSAYRYATWDKKKSMSTKPELIINGGKIENYGSGGNRAYIFTNGEYRYEISFSYAGDSDAISMELTIFKSEKEIFNQAIEYYYK
jgi:hypothetical protein